MMAHIALQPQDAELVKRGPGQAGLDIDGGREPGSVRFSSISTAVPALDPFGAGAASQPSARERDRCQRGGDRISISQQLARPRHIALPRRAPKLASGGGNTAGERKSPPRHSCQITSAPAPPPRFHTLVSVVPRLPPRKI